MCDVDFGDMLDYLAGEAEVRGILLYVESGDARPQVHVGGARRGAPEAGDRDQGRPASGGGARRRPRTPARWPAPDAVYDAAFRRAGMLRVNDIGDLFDAVETLGMGKTPKGDRLAILTNGGGIGVMATDALLDARRPARAAEPRDAGGARRRPAAAPGRTATRSTSSATRPASATPGRWRCCSKDPERRCQCWC